MYLGNVKQEILLILDSETDKDEIAERIGGLMLEKFKLIEAHFDQKMQKGFEEAYQIILELKRQAVVYGEQGSWNAPIMPSSPYGQHPFSRSNKEDF